MPDRTASPEELLDQWLDALNESESAPPAPAEIADLAGVALDYRRALATTPERNVKMHHASATASPNGVSWRIEAEPNRKASWSSWLATAAVFALLVGLVGGAALRTWGLPGENDPAHIAGIAASPGTTPTPGNLSCASPGYLPVVSGDPDAAELAAFGGPGSVIRSTDDGVFVPLPNGETRELPPESVIYPGSDLASAIHDDNAATFTRISTGETWEYAAVEPRVEEQNWDFFSNGRYVIGPTDDSRTDWLITDTLTGDTRSTADILGEPFEGSLDLWATTSSENGDTWLLQFMTLTFPDYDETPPAGTIDAPGHLVIPGSLDDAWFSDSPVRAEPIDTVVSPEGATYIVMQTVRDAKTGERIDSGEDNLTYFGDLIGYVDEDSLLAYRGDVVNTVDIHTAVTTPIYTADGEIAFAAWDEEAGTVVISLRGTQADSPTRAVLVDLGSGAATPLPALDAYQLTSVAIPGLVLGERYDPGTPGEGSTHTQVVVSTATGEVLATHTALTLDTGDAWPYRQVAVNDRFVAAVEDQAGAVEVMDREAGTSWRLPLPTAGDGSSELADARPELEFSPGGTCMALSRSVETGIEGNNVRGTITTEPIGTWIAPLERGATWTELPFAIEQWVEVDALTATDPVSTGDTQILPAQDFASPAASPGSTGLSCASPGYRAVVRGPVDPAHLALLGDDPIVRGETTTITAANGVEIELGPDQQWTVYPSSGVILSGESERALNTVTSLATGQSWTFPLLVEDSPESQAAFMLLGGPWLIGAADDSSTDWRIINTATGQERLTSDIFGAPFDQGQLPLVSPWLDRSGPALMIAFSGDAPTPSFVLPTDDLDDAWALPPEHVFASATGVITPDGKRIAYFLTSDDAASTVIVLDGVTGEEVATWSGPETDDVLQTVGLTGDDGKMILRDSQRVWTVDLATGEIATVFDPDGLIRSFEFDPITGTALASFGDGPEERYVWLDPATGETKDLDIPLPMRSPQPQFGWALIQTRDDIAVDYALLDMTAGEIATAPIGADRDENGTNVWITGGDETGVYVIQAEPGRMLVLDGPGGQAFELAAPESGRDGWNGIAIGVSPSGACLVYTEVGQGEEPGTSWIAPLAPDTEWTELPFELGLWIEMPPAPPFSVGTPAATPNAMEPVPIEEPLPPTVTPREGEAPVIEPLPRPTPTA